MSAQESLDVLNKDHHHHHFLFQPLSLSLFILLLFCGTYIP